MPNLVSHIYFSRLEEEDPLDVCRRLDCKYNSAGRHYIISVWGDDYAIFPSEKRIKRLSNNLPEHHPLLYVFIMYFITSSKLRQLTSEWISEKDLLGGPTFFRGPHKIPTDLISNKFSNNIERFKNKCEQLKGTPINMGELAYAFKITHNINVALLYWKGDDTFTSEVKLLFNNSVDGFLPLDIVFSLANDICIRFIR